MESSRTSITWQRGPSVSCVFDFERKWGNKKALPCQRPVAPDGKVPRHIREIYGTEISFPLCFGFRSFGWVRCWNKTTAIKDRRFRILALIIHDIMTSKTDNSSCWDMRAVIGKQIWFQCLPPQSDLSQVSSHACRQHAGGGKAYRYLEDLCGMFP